MINTRKYHPVLRARLLPSVEHGNGLQLCADLSQLSNADFRCAGNLLADDLLPLFPHNFWPLFLMVVPTYSKAFLGTFLKAAVRIEHLQQQFITHHMEDVHNYFESGASAIDVKKCMEALLPYMYTPTHVEQMISWATGNNDMEKMSWLLRAATPSCCYVLMKQLESIDAKDEVVRQCCLVFMKKGDERSFNMACMLQTYFGLPQLPGTFSLNLQPYELARMSESYEHFLKVLNGHPIMGK